MSDLLNIGVSALLSYRKALEFDKRLVAAHAGLFNIGGDGQAYVAGLGAIVVSSDGATQARMPDGWPCWAVSNHDVRRAVTRWGGEDPSPAFAKQLSEWLVTLRKKNASVIFATQSLSDIDGSAIAPAIIESCQTRILLPNERAAEPQIAAIYERFGLNARQIEILSRATPKRDYYCQSRRGNRLFELGLGEVALAFSAAASGPMISAKVLPRMLCSVWPKASA